MTYLPAALFAVLWMWSDLIGNLLSVISTYFYFGWEDVPLRVPKIFGIALLAFSGPLWFRLFLARLEPVRVSRTLLLLLFGLYLALALNRQSDFFAWGSVAAVWLGGMAMMSLLQNLGSALRLSSVPLYTVLMAFLFYLSTRISQSGLPLLLVPLGSQALLSWASLLVFVLAGLLIPQRNLPRPEAETTEPPPPLPLGSGSLGAVFGLLMGLSVGLIYNLHIWSAQSAELPATIYFFSLGLGSLGGWFAFQRLQSWLALGLAGLSLGLSLYTLLYLPYPTAGGLAAHLAGACGLLICWGFFLQRWQSLQQRWPGFFPWLGLQTGFVALLLILAVFLLQANPGGFWLALGLVLVILGWQEHRHGKLSLPTLSLQRLWIYSTGVFACVGLLSLFLPLSQPSLPAAPAESESLQLISSNIRYGWTDHDRFEPQTHLNYLREQKPDLLGLQEVNKGHTSGAYTDLYRLYQRHLPGSWHYGDAHYGFGNALLSRWPVEQIEVRHYQAKDMLRRSCLIATVNYQGQSLDVFVTHLSHLPPPNAVRQQQLAELVQWVGQSRNPWVLLADLNTDSRSGELEALLALAHPVFQTQPEWLDTPSFPSLEPRERIDFVLFSAAFELLSMEIPDTAGSSDHRPVIATLQLKK